MKILHANIYIKPYVVAILKYLFSIFIFFNVLPMIADDVNIARFAVIKVTPPVHHGAINMIVDGNTNTGASFMHGVAMGGIYEFIYNAPVSVTKVRFFQGQDRRFENSNSCATEYLIMADTTNNGVYDKEIIHSHSGVSGWNEHIFPPIIAYRIKFKAFKGNAPWEESYPFMREFEIYSPDAYRPSSNDKTEIGTAIDGRRGKAEAILESDNSTVTDLVFTERDKKAFIKSVVVAFWNFGLNPEMKEDNLNFKNMKIHDSPQFKDFIDKLKGLDANTICLMREEKDALACWPSNNFKTISPDRDFLQEFSDAAHMNGFKVHVNMLASAATGCLHDIKSGDYSTTQQNALKEKWGLLLKEVSEKNIDGIYVCPDEFYFRPVNLCLLPLENPTRQDFVARYNEPPPISQPGLFKMGIFRKQCLFNYEQDALLVKYWNNCVKKVNPSILTFTNLGSHPLAYNNRYVYGLAYDIIGNMSEVDYIGTDYQNDKTKFLVAATNEKTKSSMIIFPSAIPGDMLSCVLQGAKGINVYRYNYIFKEDKATSVSSAFYLCDTLANWGYDEALKPAKIVLLTSRASEDWWQFDNNVIYRANDKSVNGEIGFWSSEVIAQILDTLGYPYDVLNLDRDEDMRKVVDYPLAILPFPYSVSVKAAVQLHKAFDTRTRFLIFSKKGEVNEYGMKHVGGPVLNRIVSDGALSAKTIFSDLDPVEYDRDGDFEADLKRKMDFLLDKDKDFYFDRRGRNVRAYFLQKKVGDRLIAVNNKENVKVSVSVGSHMPKGVYGIHSASSAYPGKMFLCKLGGNLEIDADALDSFTIELKPDETRLIRIQPFL